MLLLLLLFSACFTKGLTQTTSFVTNQPDTTITAPSFSTTQPTQVVPTASEQLERLAFLHSTVESTEMLNVTSLDVVLDKISDMIREVKPDAVFTLTLKSMTEV